MTCGGNFNLDDLEPILSRIRKLVDSGLTPRRIKLICRDVQRMGVDELRVFKVPIVADGLQREVVIQCFMDDIASPNASFKTERKLGQRIRSELKAFLSARQATHEDVRATLDLNQETTELRPAQLARRVGRLRSQASLRHAKPLKDVSQLLRDPKRALILSANDPATDTIEDMYVYDAGADEFIEWKARGVSFINLCSLAGVEFVDVDSAAVRWIQDRLSGRQVRGRGKIA